jgi:hypothetical protein
VLCSYFWLNAGILAVGLVVYAFVARSYTEKPILSSERVRMPPKCALWPTVAVVFLEMETHWQAVCLCGLILMQQQHTSASC